MSGAELGVVWAAASTAFSAVLYVFDFATNISTLRTYYMYEYQCLHAPSASPLLADPICSAISSGRIAYGSVFHLWPFSGCLTCLVLAHLTYAVVFWNTLDPREHPLRLAYFLPLIHLYRLLKLLFHTLSCQDLKNLVTTQLEPSNFFNAIGASMETATLFVIQFVVAMKLGEHLKGSLDPSYQAQRIPTNLMISLIVSLISASYTTSMAMLPLLKGRMSFTRQTYLFFLMGCHTISALLGGTMCIFGLYKLSTTRFPIPLSIYGIFKLLIDWLFVDFFLQSHQYNGQRQNKYMRVAYSFVLGVITRIIGPTYVIVKFSKSPCLIILGAYLHIFVDFIGFSLVLFLPSHLKGLKSPCHSIPGKNSSLVEENVYMTCKVFISTFILSFLTFILSTLQIYCFQRRKYSTSIVPSTCTNISCGTHDKPALFEILTINEVGFLPIESVGRDSHQMTKTLLFRILLLVILGRFIQKSQKAASIDNFVIIE